MNISLRKTVSISFVIAFIFLSSFGHVMTVKAESNTVQFTQIQTLIKLIEQLQEQLAQMQQGTNVGQCIQLSRALFLGVSDRETDGEVSKLQNFLTKTGHYTYGMPTGYFGPATQTAVQAWQKSNGVVYNGSPETTGYGVTGPSTRSIMAKACKISVISENVIVSIYLISNSENPTISGEAEGANSVSLSIYPIDKYSNGNTAVIYNSGEINVLSNAWSHKVPFDLVNGKYFVAVMYKGQTKVEKSFTISTASEVELADSVTISSISNIPNSVIKGTATGVNELTLKIQKGEKTSGLGEVVYNSEDISDTDVPVVSGKWSHQVQEYLENGIYTVTVYIDNEYGQNIQIAQRVFKIYVPQSNGDIKAILEVLPSDESKMIALSDTNQVIGKELISFSIDADSSDRDVKISGLTLSLALPFVKAGVWTDMIKNVILVSEKTQQSINFSESVDSDKNVISIAGQALDEILVSFNTNALLNESFTIPKGNSREFKIIADFNPSNIVGGFGKANSIGQSVGYVQANIVNIGSNIPVFAEPGNNMKGPIFTTKGVTY